MAQEPARLTAKQLLAEAKQIPSPRGVNAVVLLDEERWIFSKNGDARRSLHAIVQILTPEGVEDWGSLQYRWEPWHERAWKVRARVVTGDGTEHTLDQASIVEGSEPGGSADRLVKAPLPAVAPGAVIEEEFEIESQQVLTGTAGVTLFGRSEPVRVNRAVFEYPDEVPLHYTAYLLPNLKTTKSSKDGVTRLVLESAPAPAMTPEEALLPGDVAAAPHVVFSTGRSWRELAAEYSRIVDEQIANANLETFVRSATAGAKNRAETIDRLVRAMHKEVRYTGVNFAETLIVPDKPAETLKRKYGDCKDKSALLVAMLRAAGIPAYLALLSAGPGEDLGDEEVGIGQFDHAVVYVPGTPDLWIDATAEYVATGVVPTEDQGRKALVIGSETTGLQAIPESPSSAHVTTVMHEIFLPDWGQARVIVTTGASGNGEALLRAILALQTGEQAQKNITKSLKGQYSTESALKIELPKADDFSQPFQTRVEIDKARIGVVSQTQGQVALPLSSLLSDLPMYFWADAQEPNSEETVQPAKKRTADFELPDAFQISWRYRIHLPPGFQVTNLPVGEDSRWGAARFTSKFQTEKDEVSVEFRFDSGKRRYTAEEGAELKKAVGEFVRRPMLVLQLQSIAQILLTQGKTREAIAQCEEMIKRYPNKAICHVQLSDALLAAGCGRKARDEAKRAADMEPTRGYVYQNLGQTLGKDLIGRDFGKGFDVRGAESAFRKALEIDPTDDNSRQGLGVALEFGEDGTRYSAGARFDEAIQVYRGAGDDLPQKQYAVNFLYDLAYTERFAELRKELDKFPPSRDNFIFKLVAIAKLQGAATAVAAADQGGYSARERSAALLEAADVLKWVRDYAAAAELGSAGAKDSDDPTQALRLVTFLRLDKRSDGPFVKVDTPENLVLSFYFATLLGHEDDFVKLTAPEFSEGMSPIEMKQVFEYGRREARVDAGDLRDLVLIDAARSIAHFTTEKNGGDGVRVQLSYGDQKPKTFYVARQGNEYRLLGATGNRFTGVGRRVLGDLKNGDLTSARQWLDWAREEITLGGGDDALAGSMFARVWSKGLPGDEAAIRYAAAILIGTSQGGKDGLPLLRAKLGESLVEPMKTWVELAYVDGCAMAGAWEESVPIAETLVATNPSSERAARGLASAYEHLGRWKDMEAWAQKRLIRDESDVFAKALLAQARASAGQFEEGSAIYLKLAEADKGNLMYWNQAGWWALFAGTVTEEKIAGLQRALGTPPNANTMQTLAMMYAEAGKGTEARETILAAMKAWGLEEPDSACWLVFGRLAEQFGVMDEARADYEMVERGADGSPLSSYALAQKRLAGLREIR